MYKATVCLAFFACVCVASLHASHYGVGPAPPAPAVVSLQRNSEAQAAAITDGAAAKAAAAKLNKASWHQVNRYGHEIGRPLLVVPYGPLTKLYAASLPARAFAGQVDPGFQKSGHGAYGSDRVQYNTGGSIGVIALP